MMMMGCEIREFTQDRRRFYAVRYKMRFMRRDSAVNGRDRGSWIARSRDHRSLRPLRSLGNLGSRCSGARERVLLPSICIDRGVVVSAARVCVEAPPKPSALLRVRGLRVAEVSLCLLYDAYDL